MPKDQESDPALRSMEATKLLLDQLSSEYKILQDKIDKIGAFKFTIRGWTVIIVVASCIGATTAHLPSPFLLLGLIVFVAVFWHMEHIQTGHREIFGRRCAEIERWIWRLLREQGAHVPRMVPKVAHEIADQTRADLGRWKNPRVRRVVHALRSHDEYVFCTMLILVIVVLTVWLSYHAKSSEDTRQIVQPAIAHPEPAPAVQPSPKTGNQKGPEQNAPTEEKTSAQH
jgi:hypothetical protein